MLVAKEGLGAGAVFGGDLGGEGCQGGAEDGDVVAEADQGEEVGEGVGGEDEVGEGGGGDAFGPEGGAGVEEAEVEGDDVFGDGDVAEVAAGGGGELVAYEALVAGGVGADPVFGADGVQVRGRWGVGFGLGAGVGAAVPGPGHGRTPWTRSGERVLGNCTKGGGRDGGRGFGGGSELGADG